MTLRNTISIRWLIRTTSALAFSAALLGGMTSQAFAHDDDEVVTYGPNACTAVADLPAYSPATCRKHTTELDDGVTETTNSYLTADRANTVRLAFEQTFASNGWTIGADASVTLVNVGANARIDSATAKQAVIGYVLTKGGLMADVSLEGTKITPISI